MTILRKNCVCGVVAARTAVNAQRQLRRALRSTHTVELRFDWFANAKEIGRFLLLLKTMNVSRRAMLIATCRRREAGGKFSGALTEQLSVLRSAIYAGCNWVDIEIETVSELPAFTLDLCTLNAKRIISHHDFRGTPDSSRLAQILHRMIQMRKTLGCEAVKIATQCDSLHDALRLCALARQRKDQNIIAVPMGDIATPARILAPRLGFHFSYAPVEQSTAPGQIPLAALQEFYPSGNLNARTRVYAVIGNPIAHSLSPVMHNAAFRARRIDAIYLPFRVVDLHDFLQSIDPLGVAGFSITLPHKEKILAHLDRIDPLAASIGAVNTVAVSANGKLFGYNTDCIGVLRALDGRLALPGSRVLILGAGGAARAAAFTLAQAGVAVSICSRRPEKARQLARAVHGESVLRTMLRKMSFDAIINGTPVGMHPHSGGSPVALRELNCRLAFDTVYRPRRTKFLRLAAKRGIETVSGVEMFLAQGIAQWEIWTGQSAPASAMRRAVLEALHRDEQRAPQTRK